MRPFAAEVAGISGWHDGRVINVQDYASEDDDVRYHEAQLGSIYLNTPDGQMLHACIRYRPERLQRFSRCARVQHKLSMTELGSLRPCGAPARRMTGLAVLHDAYGPYRTLSANAGCCSRSPQCGHSPRPTALDPNSSFYGDKMYFLAGIRHLNEAR